MGSSSYPEQLDTDLELPRVDNNITEIGGDSINAIRDAVISIEGAIGISPQGNKESLAERIDVSIDSNGNIKASALESAGVVSLPIVDAQVGSTAGIKEYKLDLDYSTSSLNIRINSAVTNIEANEQSINSISSSILDHYDGSIGRHDGYDIDLQTAIRGVNTVEEALNEINSAFVVFENYANDIFSVVNIEAIESIESDIVEIQGDIVDGHDRFFNNAITTNERGEQGTQGNLIETTAASTIFRTDTAVATNILQVMRPNVARVSGKLPDLGGLSTGSADKLRIQAGGVDRDPLDVDFSNPSYIPTDDIDDIVRAINTEAQLAANHYPISAYNVSGKLVIAHNIQGPQYTIKIENVSQSAHVQLGFEDVVGTEFTWSEDYHAVHIGGNIITDMKPFIRMRYSHSGGTEINPNLGNLIDLFEVSDATECRIICNILDHSVTGNNYNGTYYIDTVAGSVMYLNTSVPAGDFDIDVTADAVNFVSAATEKIYDIFLEPATGYDGYGIVTKSLRASYLTISGLAIKTINKTFPVDGTIEWAGGDELYLQQDSVSGVTVSVPSGFTGQLQVYMPDNINSALIEVTGTPGSLKKSLTPYEFAGSDDHVYLSSVHHPLGTDELRYVIDKRQIGVSTDFQDELDPDNPENQLKDLRNNGVIRGFDVISNTTDTIKVRGGRALIEGKILDIETTDVTIDDFNDDFRTLALDKSGTYKTFDADEPGYSEEELAADGYSDVRQIATITSFGTTSSALTGEFVDRRIFVNKIDGRLLETETRLDSRIDQLESSVGGVMWGFTETFTTDSDGNFISDIRTITNPGFRFLEEPGFLGVQTTRRYEFLDSEADAYTIFSSPGLTHINIMLQIEFADESGTDPFGVSGAVNFYVGANVLTGIANNYSTESYVIVKTMQTTYMSADSVVEQYVASIPVSEFGLDTNVMFDVVPRIKITGSTYIDGGAGGGSTPIMRFGKIRIVNSSYSVAGNILGVDGSDVALATNLGDVL
jgi:hypothetical protein